MTLNELEKVLYQDQNSTDDFNLRVLSIKKGTSSDFCYKQSLNALIFILEGKLSISYNGNKKRTLQAKDFFLMPQDAVFNIDASSDSEVLGLGIRSLSQINSLISSHLAPKNPSKRQKDKDSFYILKGENMLMSCLKEVKKYQHNSILTDKKISMIKIVEILYLLDICYKPEQLSNLFRPMVNHSDLSFKEIVLKNYKKTSNIQELADMANYSLSGFEKKFLREFDMYPYQWILKQKVGMILQEITGSNKPLKQICEEYKLSSTAYLSRFCKKHYGQTPSDLRKKK